MGRSERSEILKLRFFSTFSSSLVIELEGIMDTTASVQICEVVFEPLVIKKHI